MKERQAIEKAVDGLLAEQDDSPYNNWLRAVHDELESLVGMGRADLPDAPYWDWYEDGYTPRQAAKRAVRYADGYD